MGTQSYRRDTCRLCGANDLALVLQLAPTPPVDAYVPAARLNDRQEAFPLDVFLCLACGHVQLLDVVSPDLLFGDYIYETSSSPGLVDHFREHAETVVRLFAPPRGSLVVDVGSNDGTLLGFFKEAGLQPLGVDPAHEIARRATESGLETIAEFFTSALARDMRRSRGPAAIVSANNVFAHMDDLGDVADGVQELLAPDGVFVFEVHYLVDLIEGMVFDFIYHEHLCYHSVGPLDNFLRLHGMELIDVHRIPTKGGSIRCFAQLTGAHRAIAASVADAKSLEANLALDTPATFRAFQAKIAGVKNELLDQLGELKALGKTIAGYGASATVTVLVHHFDLGPMLDFLVDDNPSRQHLYSPGQHIPVLAPQAMYEQMPDYVLVLAWRFSDMIVKKHRTYLDAGGHFIVPLPKVEVL